MLIETYLSTLLVLACALAIGQAAIALCGVRRWSWLSPAVGLALLAAICWGTVRLPGDGLVSAIAVAALTAASALYLRGRVEGGREALRLGLPVAAIALAAASLPFLVEGHFGILGTGFNPDMSQHLLSADRLASGDTSELLRQGYPLGPHAIVVALHQGFGVGLVQAFDGLTVAVAALAALTALAAFEDSPAPLRIAGALVVALTYMVASYFAQGAFKETMQALFVLAFVLSLREIARSPDWRDVPLRFVPPALIAVGSVYSYSYPGLVWLAAIAVIWIAGELLLSRRPAIGAAAGRAILLALLLFLVLVAPEIGRMVEFHNFETFDPNGPGLGNLFTPISPAEVLGIWPSGDFRLSPGDGAVPAFGYYLGAAFAGLLLAYGLVLSWGRREFAILSGLIAVAGVYAIAAIAGTPYTEAKAIVIASPVVALVIVGPLLRRPAGWLYMLAAGGCALLAFANAPVGPSAYHPELTGLRPAIARGSTLVLASRQLLDEEQGARYIVWELRGGRVCVASEDEAGGSVPTGVTHVITEDDAPQPFADLRLERSAGPYKLWIRRVPHHVLHAPRGKRDEEATGKSPCPLIAVRQARQGPG